MINNSANIANAGSTPFVAYINKNFLQVFEPELYFKQFAEAPISQRGHNSVTWIKPDRYAVNAAQATLTPGVTPSDTPMKLNTINATAVQYGIYTVLSDEVMLIGEGYNLGGYVGELLGKNMARIVDAVIQTEVMAGTNVMYASTTSGGTRAANRAAITGITYKPFRYDFEELYARLRSNYSPFIDGQNYVSVIHPAVSMLLRTETTAGGWTDVAKYSQPDKVFNGEVGKIAGIRLVESAYVQTFASTTTVYPTLVIGKQAYGISWLSDIETIVHALGSAGTSDPLNQRMTIGSKVFFAAKRLQEDSMYRLESAWAF